MKTALHILGQLLLFAAFLALFFGGGMLGPFNLDPFGGPRWWLSHPTPNSTRYFVPSGLLLMTALWLGALAIEAIAKRMRRAGLFTSIAYLLALIIGLAFKFGWVEVS